MAEPEPAPGSAAELDYLRTPRAIRERCEALYALARADRLEHFALDERALDAVVERVLAVTRAAYPDLRAIPYHGRFRHFGAGGVDRLARLDAAIGALSREEQLMSRFELVITSVLLDAGAGADWVYRDANGVSLGRSEGLAVASFDWFASGGLSLDGAAPYRADAAALERISADGLANAFQVGPENPLVGLDGRARLLNELGRVVREQTRYFGTPPRLGALGLYLVGQAERRELEAARMLSAVLLGLGEIWPGRETLLGQNLGDVFTHPAVGRVPFHKLSQWLTYSLCEPLEAAGLVLRGLPELTGLAEYRNGGLFIDGGVLVPKHDRVLGEAHAPASEVVVEWRALTVALLDRTAERLRARLGLSAEELPLARVLEGGTWRAGRVLAAEKRPGGAPPLRVVSDGTVF
ncbi:MAG TPA: DUF1688 family protein [Polyangiaceae bacterium]